MAETKHRLQFDFSQEAYHALVELRAKSSASTNAEVIIKALGAYKWIVDQLEAGHEIMLKKDGNLATVKFAP